MFQDQTSVGLLDRLQNASNPAWNRLNAIYMPLIQKWLRLHGVNCGDADDIAQDVLIVVLRRLPDFQRNREGSFRCWLRLITVNCLRDHRRKQWRQPATCDAVGEMLQNLEEPNSELSRRWDVEHDVHVLNYAMTVVKNKFTEQTWSAFIGTAIEGRHPGDVAAELDTTENAVCIAKSRVSTRIRKVSQDLLC